jgi:hypothetical protein
MHRIARALLKPSTRIELVHAHRVKTVCENGLIRVAALQRLRRPTTSSARWIECRRAQIQSTEARLSNFAR